MVQDLSTRQESSLGLANDLLHIRPIVAANGLGMQLDEADRELLYSTALHFKPQGTEGFPSYFLTDAAMVFEPLVDKTTEYLGRIAGALTSVANGKKLSDEAREETEHIIAVLRKRLLEDLLPEPRS